MPPPLRILVFTVMACASVLCGWPAAGAATAATTASRPRPLPEGPAGPPARLPNGRIARPPRRPPATAGAACHRAAYGPKFYAPGTGKTVALSFDDGPGRSTLSILNLLRKYRVPATFFNLGQNAAARPRLLRRELADGYVLGNHTWDHADLTDLSASKQAAEIDEMSAEQHRITGTRPCNFRPPYGAYNRTTLHLAQRRRMRVWIWSVDTEDWKAEGSGSSYWVHRIIRLAETEGADQQHPLILMHNQPIGNPATVAALPVIIRYFQHHHYRFVKL
ncbi:MAG TPA: polysaccharide deacetylase family protein [Streptosporangiaceae bacterium]